MTTRKLQGPLGGDYQTDGNGNAVLLNTYPLTGEDDVPLRLADHEARVTAAEAITPLVRQTNYVAALGDSITIGSGSDTNGYLGPNVPFTWACLLSNGVLVPVVKGNQGIGGQTSTQIAARASAITTLTPKPSRCLIMAGTNDCNGSLNLTTYATNINTIVSTLRAANIEPVLLAIPPKSTNNTEVARVNAWLQLFGTQNSIQVIDLYTPFQDGATGGWRSGFDGDGTHPTAATAKLMGQIIWDALKDRITPTVAVLPTGHASDPANLVVNGVFVGDTNADGCANSWTPNGLGSADSLVSGGSTVPGNWQRTTLSFTGTVFFDQLISGWSIGDTLLFCGRVRGTLATSESLSARMKFNGASQQWMSPVYLIDQSIDAGDGYVFAMVGVVPTGTTSVDVQLVPIGATSGNTVDFAQITVRNLTALGLA